MRTCTLYTIDVLYIILYLSLSVFVYYTYSMRSYRHTGVNVRVCVRECVCVRDGVLVSRISIHLNSKNMHHLVQPPVSHLLSSPLLLPGALALIKSHATGLPVPKCSWPIKNSKFEGESWWEITQDGERMWGGKSWKLNLKILWGRHLHDGCREHFSRQLASGTPWKGRLTGSLVDQQKQLQDASSGNTSNTFQYTSNIFQSFSAWRLPKSRRPLQRRFAQIDLSWHPQETPQFHPCLKLSSCNTSDPQRKRNETSVRASAEFATSRQRKQNPRETAAHLRERQYAEIFEVDSRDVMYHLQANTRTVLTQPAARNI